MSSLITAGRFLVESHDKKLIPPKINATAFRILAEVIQNVLDGYYQKNRNILYYDVHFREEDTKKPDEPSVKPLRVNIVGLSLGDGDDIKFLVDRKSIQDCIDGVKGSIHILCESGGEIMGINLSEIQKITRTVALKVIQTEPPKSTQILPQESPATVAGTVPTEMLEEMAA